MPVESLHQDFGYLMRLPRLDLLSWQDEHGFSMAEQSH